jgi:hypothetical protein
MRLTDITEIHEKCNTNISISKFLKHITLRIIFHLKKYFLYYTESIPKFGIVFTVTVFAVAISYYNRDGKDNHILLITFTSLTSVQWSKITELGYRCAITASFRVAYVA